jgi:eukaryotic-like serine/threonine-protein kinase
MQRLHEGFVQGSRYTLAGRFASGGMADVWAGRDQVLHRDVAVKVMRPDIPHEKLFALRFRDEALHSARLVHANIATVFDYGERDGLAYLVVELVDGQALSAVLRDRGPLPHGKVRSIVGQAALALAVAHQARVVHRDVKPANILIRRDGLVKLTDFGIARALDASGHTLHGEVLGTPNYVSPEQVLGQAATGASDLYALGIVAHEMLSGRRPLDRETPFATAFSHVQEPPPPLPQNLPEDLALVIEDCLNKHPQHRPPHATAVALRLGLGDNEIMGLGLGLAWSVDDTAPNRHTAEHPSPDTILAETPLIAGVPSTSAP